MNCLQVLYRMLKIIVMKCNYENSSNCCLDSDYNKLIFFHMKFHSYKIMVILIDYKNLEPYSYTNPLVVKWI